MLPRYGLLKYLNTSRQACSKTGELRMFCVVWGYSNSVNGKPHRKVTKLQTFSLMG